MCDTWHDACMPCGYVQPIKRGSVEEKREGEREERERERGRGRKIRKLLHLISGVLTVGVRRVES